MKNNISLALNPEIRAKLTELAKERGITLQELIRWVLGEYVKKGGN